MCLLTTTGVASALSVSMAVAKAIAITGNIIMAVGTIAGTTISTVSSVKSANASAKMNEYQAKVAKDNAKIAEENARNERQSGLEESRRQRLRTLQTIGSQQTAMAANGIDISSGTALDTVQDTAELGELDSLMIQYNSERTAFNYETQANNFTNQANLDMFAAKNAKTTGYLNAAGNAASSVANYGMSLDANKVASSWNKVKNNWNGQMTGSAPSINY